MSDWNYDDRIITTAERGTHISLYCINHPNLRWHTKNIAPIGCRTIFFDLHNECNARECDCSIATLKPVA